MSDFLDEAYGPGDIVKRYQSWDYQPARHAVQRLMRTAKLSEAENELARHL